MSKLSKIITFAAVMGVSILVFFQNCAQPYDSLSGSISDTDDGKLPFAFDSKLDTISYMSCTGMDVNYSRSAYFTFRFGAYTPNAGVRIRSEFIDATRKYSPQERLNLLQISQKNQGARPQVALRGRTDYQALWIADGAAPSEGRDYVNLLDRLDSDVIAEQLINSPEGLFLNYFQASGISNRTLDGSIYLVADQPQNLQTLSEFPNRIGLALTYQGVGDEYLMQARSPVDLTGTSHESANNAYGMMYVMDFSVPFGITASNMPRRLLSSIQEMNMEKYKTTEGVSSWECGSEYHFKIVRHEDAIATPTLCARSSDAAANAREQEILDAVRRVLPVSDWYVDMAKRCIVPKVTGMCYGAIANPTPTTYSVNYSPTTSCNLYNPFNTGSGGAAGNTNMCPHYFSMCVRR